MSKAPEAVYRSNNAAVLIVFAQWKVDQAAINKRIAAFRKKYSRGGRRIMQNGRYVTGLDNHVRKGRSWVWSDEIPEGWRMHHGKYEVYLVPNRKTPLGKEIFKEMKTLYLPDLRGKVPGMPGDMLTAENRGLVSYSPGYEMLDDGYLYCTWGTDPRKHSDDWGKRHIDSKIWKRVKLSEYHRIKGD